MTTRCLADEFAVYIGIESRCDMKLTAELRTVPEGSVGFAVAALPANRTLVVESLEGEDVKPQRFQARQTR